jgi:geranylgeranyl transferase type-1 subunit beta
MTKTASQSDSQHRAYFNRLLQLLPYEYSSLDSSRITLIYFCLSALDLLGGSAAANDENLYSAADIRQFILSLQCFIRDNGEAEMCGFRGGTFAGNSFNPQVG